MHWKGLISINKLSDVYNGKIDLGSVDQAWLHDSNIGLYHIHFGCDCCDDPNTETEAELDYYHETDPEGFHDYFGSDYCGCEK